MSEETKPINGLLFALFWFACLGVLAFLFARWHENNIGGIEQVVVNKSKKEILIRMDRANTYRANGEINGIKVRFIVDTGANSVAIPKWLAEKAQLKPLRRIGVQTAGGKTVGYMTRIKKLSIGPIDLYNVKAIIMPDESKYVLLGMTALRKLELRHRDRDLLLIQHAEK